MYGSSVWAKIDQLERTVLSQAKEIDDLKRSVNRIETFSNPRDHRHQSQPVQSHRYHRDRDHYSSTSDRTRESSRHISPDSVSYPHQSCHPYQMNSFVHPPSAIPPRSSVRWHGPSDQRSELASRRDYRSPPRTPPMAQSRPQASSSQRWSAAPNLASTADDVIGELGDSQESVESLTRHKHNRQRFVEPPLSQQPVADTPPECRPVVSVDKPQAWPDSDDEFVDVEKLDSSDVSVIDKQSDNIEGSSAIAVALAQTDSRTVSRGDSDADSDVQEVARIPARPKKSSGEKRPLKEIVEISGNRSKKSAEFNQVAKIEPGASSSTFNNTSSFNRSSHVTTKTPFKTVPKKNRAERNTCSAQPADQTWIWSKDPARPRPSLPTKLKEVINNSPF